MSSCEKSLQSRSAICQLKSSSWRVGLNLDCTCNKNMLEKYKLYIKDNFV